MSAGSEKCNGCRFWREEKGYRDPADADFGFGHCRRNPPRLMDSMVEALRPKLRYGQQTEPDIETPSLSTASMFPATFAGDWCGAFEPIGGEWTV